MKKYFFLGLNLIAILVFNAQIKNTSFSKYYNFNNHVSSIKHSSIQPYLESHQINVDSNERKNRSKIGKKVFTESLLNIVENDVHLTADPLFNFTIGPKHNSGNYRYHANVRGFRITGDLGNNISFETRFYENQFLYPDFLKEKSVSRSNPSQGIDGIAFGLGRAKNFEDFGNDASLANGYFSYSPSKYLNFQIGHGRHFFGDGYRSHLMSDYAPDYPYISGQYYLFNKKLLYKHVTAWMRNLNRIPAASTPEALFIPKSTSFNQLSFSPNAKFSIAIFEGGVYQSYELQNGNINPDLSFYSPIIGTKLIDIDTVNNIIYGFNGAYNLFINLKIYNQIAIKYPSKSYGFQLGIIWDNPFKIENSFLNFEWNNSPTSLYSMQEGQQFQSYSHLGHELAHPMGAGFQEFLFRGQLSYKLLFIRFNYNYAKMINNYSGNEIFEFLDNQLFNIILDNRRLFLNTNVGVMLNKATNMELSIGHLTRIKNNLAENYIFLSWRTYLKNDYFDQ